MSGTQTTPNVGSRAAVAGKWSPVTIFTENGEMTVPLWVAEIINPGNRFRDQRSGVTAGLAAAVHTYSLGSAQREVAVQMMDDEFHRCGNEPHPIFPRPHWTDLLSALAQYGSSLPNQSAQRGAAFALCKHLLDTNARAVGE